MIQLIKHWITLLDETQFKLMSHCTMVDYIRIALGTHQNEHTKLFLMIEVQLLTFTKAGAAQCDQFGQDHTHIQ